MNPLPRAVIRATLRVVRRFTGGEGFVLSTIEPLSRSVGPILDK